MRFVIGIKQELDGRIVIPGFAVMPTPRSARFQDHFADLTDPRRRKVVYPLINIVAIAICAVIAGADDFVSIALWCVRSGTG